jgi:hypothetical protein
VTQNVVSYWEKPSLTPRQRRLFHARRFTLAGHFVCSRGPTETLSKVKEIIPLRNLARI